MYKIYAQKTFALISCFKFLYPGGTKPISVVLNNGGTWSITPWIKQCDCKLHFMCCGNGKEMSYRYYVLTAGNQIPSGTNNTSTTKLKGPDTSLYEQELANFVSKSKDGKDIAVLKKRQLKIDTAFMSKKPKQQHRLGSYLVTAKYPTSSKETSHNQIHNMSKM